MCVLDFNLYYEKNNPFLNVILMFPNYLAHHCNCIQSLNYHLLLWEPLSCNCRHFFPVSDYFCCMVRQYIVSMYKLCIYFSRLIPPFSPMLKHGENFALNNRYCAGAIHVIPTLDKFLGPVVFKSI